MDIYKYLKKDHEKVSALFEKAIAARSASRRKSLFEEIKHELTLHAETEEATFYAALKGEEETGERIDHAYDEHDEMRDYMDKLTKMSPESLKWMELLGEFKHSVTHHVEEEEGEIFKKAKKVLSPEQVRDLAIEMDDLKQQKQLKMRKSA